MISDFFCNTVYVRVRQETTVYENWISRKQYTDSETQIACRVSSLNYKDLQLLEWIDDVKIKVQKLYTAPTVTIKPTDYVIWKWESYQVIAEYEVQDKDWEHHHKYFIKLVS